MRIILLSAIIYVAQLSHRAQCQEQILDDQEIISIENLYKNNPPVVAPRLKEKSLEVLTQQEQKEQLNIKNNTEVQKSKIRSLADLNQLVPFSDISVIQKKYLPKTEFRVKYVFIVKIELLLNDKKDVDFSE